MKTLELSIILPCFNEQENLKRIPAELLPVLKDLKKDFEIIIVDDGSTDNSVKETLKIKNNQIKLIKHHKNLGAGVAFQTGFNEAKGKLLITMDTDLTFSPKFIPLLLETMKKNPSIDFIIGSPRLGGYGKNVKFWRIIISKLSNRFYSFLLGKKVTAVTPFFRLYKTDQIKNLVLESKGFEIMAEILFKLVFSGKNFIEVPTPLTKRIYGVSHLNYPKEIVRHLFLVSKIIKWKFFNFK